MCFKNVEDVLWVVDAADEIRTRYRFPAYFIPDGPGLPENSEIFYAMVALPLEFKAEHADAWRRLVKDATLTIDILGTGRDVAPNWDCLIVRSPSSIALLADHPTAEHELVLRVRRPTQREPKRVPEHAVTCYPSRAFANHAMNRGFGH